MKQLDVDADVASILVQEGFFDHRRDRLRSRQRIERHRRVRRGNRQGVAHGARAMCCLTQAIASEESVDGAEPGADLIRNRGRTLGEDPGAQRGSHAR